MKGKLDMVVGMQYGDEGKGASCVMLHREQEYGFSVRVGGSQAEHRFRVGDNQYRVRVLPSACCFDQELSAYLGAGHVVREDILLSEINKYRSGSWDKITMDINTCISSIGDRADSKYDAYHEKRGGYGMGVSTALCRKIRRNPHDKVTAAQHQLSHLSNVPVSIWADLESGKNGLVEGTQGALLSLNHGDYPYVTSQDVNAPAIMGSLGLSMAWVNNIYGVVRSFPMRVAGDSGHMIGEEIDFETVEREMGIVIPESRKWQTNEDGTPNKMERLCRFSDQALISGILQSAPHFIILTHCDWIPPSAIDRITDQIQNIGQFFLKRKLRVSHYRFGDGINEYRRSQH